MGCKVKLDRIANLVTVSVLRDGKPEEQCTPVTEDELRKGYVAWPRWLMRMAQKMLKEHDKKKSNG